MEFLEVGHGLGGDLDDGEGEAVEEMFLDFGEDGEADDGFEVEEFLGWFAGVGGVVDDGGEADLPATYSVLFVREDEF